MRIEDSNIEALNQACMITNYIKNGINRVAEYYILEDYKCGSNEIAYICDYIEQLSKVLFEVKHFFNNENEINIISSKLLEILNMSINRNYELVLEIIKKEMLPIINKTYMDIESIYRQYERELLTNIHILKNTEWIRKNEIFRAAYCDNENSIFIEKPVNTDYGDIINQVKMLNNVVIGRGTYKLASGMFSPNVIIGRYCSISHFVNIGATNHHMEYLYTGVIDNIYKNDKNAENECKQNYTIIGCDVWIGVNVSILSGVKIGHGACIGAGSIVTKDIPPYAVAVGNPAKVIKYRFSDKIIEQLLELKWWELEPEIIKNIPYKDINKSIEYLKRIKCEQEAAI